MSAMHQLASIRLTFGNPNLLIPNCQNCCRKKIAAFVNRACKVGDNEIGPEAFLKFLGHLEENPSRRTINDLYLSIGHNDIEIDKDGYVICYKVVRDDWKDVYTGKIDNSVGSVIKMPRNQTGDDDNRTCSKGLHAASLRYLRDSRYGQDMGGNSVWSNSESIQRTSYQSLLITMVQKLAYASTKLSKNAIKTCCSKIAQSTFYLTGIIATSNTKRNCSMKKHVAIAIALMTSPAFAANLVSGTQNKVAGNYNTVIGEKLNIDGYGNAVTGTDIVVAGYSNAASGIHNVVTGKNNVVSGHNAAVKGNMSVAIGQLAEAYNSMVTAVGSGSKGLGESSVAIGKGATTGVDAKAGTAVGPHATSMGSSSFAGGLHAYSGGVQSTALGQSSRSMGEKSTAVGSGTQALERFSTAIGGNAIATNQHDVALGFGSKTTGAVGTTTAEVNGVKYGAFAGHRPVGETSMGSEGWERNVTNVAAGRITAASTDAVNGSQLFAVANQVGGNAKGVKANADAIKALDGKVAQNVKNIASLNSGLDAIKNDVAVNANNIAGNTQQIATLNYTVQQQNIWNEVQDQQIADNKAATDKHTSWNQSQDKAIAGLQNDVASNTDRISSLTELVNGVSANEARLRKEMHDLRRESRAGIAGANAIASIPQPHAPGQTAIGVGAGYFKHEGAVAVGMSHISNSGKWVSKAGVNFDTRKNVGAAVGLSYVWGGVPVVVPAPVVINKTEVVEKVIIREVEPVPAQVKVRQ